MPPSRVPERKGSLVRVYSPLEVGEIEVLVVKESVVEGSKVKEGVVEVSVVE